MVAKICLMKSPPRGNSIDEGLWVFGNGHGSGCGIDLYAVPTRYVPIM